MKNTKGFVISRLLLALVVAGLIGLTGWYVWHTKHMADSTYNAVLHQNNTVPQTANTGNASQAADKLATQNNTNNSTTVQKSTNKTTTTPAPTSVTPPASGPTVTDTDNGKTVNITIGQTLTVQLASTYWTIDGSSNSAILKMNGQTTYQPQAGAIPGEGTGTATAQFSALAKGTVTVTASRTSCGEARGCTGDQGNFSVTIIID